MAVFSSLKSNLIRLFKGGANNAHSQLRFMSGGHHKVMEVKPSRFQYLKLKDLLHFYSLVGLIPVGLIIFYSNIFIGPSTLREIPEDYTPQHWEYYRHPITRFLARYVFTPPQQEYEKFMHRLYEEDEKMKIRILESKVEAKMAERKDYHAFYYVPIDGKYHRIARQQSDELAEVGGWVGPKSGPPV